MFNLFELVGLWEIAWFDEEKEEVGYAIREKAWEVQLWYKSSCVILIVQAVLVALVYAILICGIHLMLHLFSGLGFLCIYFAGVCLCFIFFDHVIGSLNWECIFGYSLQHRILWLEWATVINAHCGKMKIIVYSCESCGQIQNFLHPVSKWIHTWSLLLCMVSWVHGHC